MIGVFTLMLLDDAMPRPAFMPCVTLWLLCRKQWVWLTIGVAVNPDLFDLRVFSLATCDFHGLIVASLCSLRIHNSKTACDH